MDDLFTSDSSALGRKCPGLLSGLFICLCWQCRLVRSPSRFPPELTPSTSCRTQRGSHGGLAVRLPLHLQKRPLGLAWSGEVPGDGHGDGPGSLCGIKETTSTRSRSLSRSWELDCSGLKCCLCYSLVVWPHANGLTSRILRFLLCYKGIMTPVSCYLMSRAYAKHLACSKVSLTCVGSF